MYAEILFAKPIGKNKDILTYEVPESFEIKTGQIVEVPLRKKTFKGVIFRVHNIKPDYNTRKIEKIILNAPHLSSWQIELAKWIAGYYFCPLSKALKLFLPINFIKKKKIKPWIAEDIIQSDIKNKNQLTKEQKNVLEKISSEKEKINLLHGITGSGKTEIYLNLADQYLEKGKQVLMLIPEISLTPQTVQRFKNHFHQKIAVIHSQLSDKEKELEWLSIHKKEAKIVIGSRSALFAPFQDLGIIIIDEEHETSYKQDQSPRYNTLDVAKQMAKLLNIQILLGSATPSLENYYLAKKNEYSLVELKNRAGKEENIALPPIKIIDMREEIKKKNFSIFSELLYQKIAEKIQKKEQCILFLNRRGAASAVICRSCGYIEKCQNCDIALTYHRKLATEDKIFSAERLICHHCGLIKKVPTICPNCESHYIKYIGVGTQRVEEELLINFPSARILRADRDTVYKKDHFKNIYEQFKNHQADILVGTQMIALGLHLPKVSLVGIILAELTLTLPNFRSSERTFQLLTQVAGRAGRADIPGEVIIQSYIPNHYAIQTASKHDYESFYNIEIELRKSLNYPPFGQLIKLTLQHKNNKTCHEMTQKVFQLLEEQNKEKIFQITFYPALIPKLHNNYRFHILINGKNPEKLLKDVLPNIDEKIKESLKIDVDPLSTI